MNFAVIIVGGVVALIGAAFVLAPQRLKPVFRRLLEEGRTDVAVFVRAAFGALLFTAAPETRQPSMAVALGVLLWISAAAIPLLGPARIQRFADWWLERSDLLLRLWGLLAAAFGVYVTWLGS